MSSLDTELRSVIKSNDTSLVTEAADLLDQGKLNALTELEKRAADPFLISLIDRFLMGLPDDLGRVKAEWATADVESTVVAAHALAGAAAMVGAGALARAAWRMCASPQDLYMTELASVAAQTAVALKTWRDTIAT